MGRTVLLSAPYAARAFALAPSLYFYLPEPDDVEAVCCELALGMLT